MLAVRETRCDRLVGMQFSDPIEFVGEMIDIAGVAAIVIGATVASVIAAGRVLRRGPDVYRWYRRILGRTILLGLELLVAADIIKTVAITPTVESVLLLGVIVLIRTFLSWSLELEISGRWPWQHAPAAESTK